MYLFDTNIVSELIKPRPVMAVVERTLACDPQIMFASELTRYELRYGAFGHPDVEKFWQRIESELLPRFQWLPIDQPVSMLAAQLANAGRQKGQSIDLPDTLIAATARAHNLTVITRNVRDFERMPGLRFENWFPE